ncbi:MAG: hypothetical protein QOI03_1702 [Solirubrobacteraceae bacterium]|jgi:hypothetical protein|nr:hypothetical protein [Solirubrobacteraceae bacterium]
MISSEVQRTLVKSPPELWTELSDPASLARHLGEFGAIRITRLEPERSIEWEGETAAGTVLIKPSGWGTRVTLRATRATPAPQHETAPAQDDAQTGSPVPEPAGIAEQDHAVQAPSPAPAIDGEQFPAAAPGESETTGAHEPQPASETLSPAPPEPDAAIEPGAEVEGAPALGNEAAEQLEQDGEALKPRSVEDRQDPSPRNQGFFARLFRRARRPEATERALTPAPAEELQPALATESFEPHASEYFEPRASESFQPLPAEDPAPPESDAPTASALAPSETDAPAQGEPPGFSMSAEAEPTPESSAQPQAADLSAAEESASEEVTEVLTSMLDRLGTAHHRPFSRA